MGISQIKVDTFFFGGYNLEKAVRKRVFSWESIESQWSVETDVNTE